MDKCVWIPLNDDEKPELAFNLDGKLYSPGYASSFEEEFVATIPDNIHLSHRECPTRSVEDESIFQESEYEYYDDTYSRLDFRYCTQHYNYAFSVDRTKFIPIEFIPKSRDIILYDKEMNLPERLSPILFDKDQERQLEYLFWIIEELSEKRQFDVKLTDGKYFEVFASKLSMEDVCITPVLEEARKLYADVQEITSSYMAECVQSINTMLTGYIAQKCEKITIQNYENKERANHSGFSNHTELFEPLYNEDYGKTLVFSNDVDLDAQTAIYSSEQDDIERREALEEIISVSEQDFIEQAGEHEILPVAVSSDPNTLEYRPEPCECGKPECERCNPVYQCAGVPGRPSSSERVAAESVAVGVQANPESEYAGVPEEVESSTAERKKRERRNNSGAMAEKHDILDVNEPPQPKKEAIAVNVRETTDNADANASEVTEDYQDVITIDNVDLEVPQHRSIPVDGEHPHKTTEEPTRPGENSVEIMDHTDQQLTDNLHDGVSYEVTAGHNCNGEDVPHNDAINCIQDEEIRHLARENKELLQRLNNGLPLQNSMQRYRQFAATTHGAAPTAQGTNESSICEIEIEDDNITTAKMLTAEQERIVRQLEAKIVQEEAHVSVFDSSPAEMSINISSSTEYLEDAITNQAAETVVQLPVIEDENIIHIPSMSNNDAVLQMLPRSQDGIIPVQQSCGAPYTQLPANEVSAIKADLAVNHAPPQNTLASTDINNLDAAHVHVSSPNIRLSGTNGEKGSFSELLVSRVENNSVPAEEQQTEPISTPAIPSENVDIGIPVTGGQINSYQECDYTNAHTHDAVSGYKLDDIYYAEEQLMEKYNQQKLRLQDIHGYEQKRTTNLLEQRPEQTHSMVEDYKQSLESRRRTRETLERENDALRSINGQIDRMLEREFTNLSRQNNYIQGEILGKLQEIDRMVASHSQQGALNSKAETEEAMGLCRPSCRLDTIARQ